MQHREARGEKYKGIKRHGRYRDIIRLPEREGKQ